MKQLYVARNSTVASRLLGGEMIMMCPETSELFTLNSVGTAIWEALDGATPLQEIVEQKVCSKFEIDWETAFRDALTFVQDLARHGILSTSEHPFSLAAGPAPQES